MENLACIDKLAQMKVYFNLFLVIRRKFGSLFYTTVITYKPLYGTPLLGLPVVRVFCFLFFFVVVVVVGVELSRLRSTALIT